MGTINKITLLGRLGRDPEMTRTQKGQAVTRFSMATNNIYTDKDGVKHSTPTWHKVVFFGPRAEVAAEYLAKGREVYVEGRVEIRNYTDKAGVEKISYEVIGSDLQLLGGRPTEAKAEQKLAENQGSEVSNDAPPMDEEVAAQASQSVKTQGDDAAESF